MCRERAAKRPQDSAAQHKLLGLLRSPFATRGRSYLQQGADGRAEQSQVIMALKALKAAHTPVGAALCRERAAKRPQDSAAQHKLLGLLRSPFATRGRSYLQQGADGRAEQSQVIMALKALKAAHTPVGAALCRERAAKRPQDSAAQHKLLGLLRSPFATRGRSYNSGVGKSFQPSAVSRNIITANPPITPSVAAVWCPLRWVSGITSWDTTNSIAPAASPMLMG
ncbi:hypothetical protein D3C78_589340 [compost metagenome]